MNAYSLSNPHLNIQFEKRCKDILTLPCWLDSRQLGGANTEEDVIRRGFHFQAPSNGIKLRVGEILEPESSKDTVRKALLCHIAVGRAFVVNEETAIHDAIPAGYDSFYLPGSLFFNYLDKDEAEGNAIHKKKYHHDYYIKSASQILPQYLVTYEYNPELEKQVRDKPMCDYCEEQEASTYCQTDLAHFCGKCDLLCHNNKITSRHPRTAVGEGANVFGKCRFHAEKSIEYFCSQCIK